MSGSKIITNKSSVALRVTLIGRISENPSNASAYIGTAYIAAGAQVNIIYGNDANPYLNEVRLQFSDAAGTVEQSLLVFQRGGRLDNAFNTNSTLDINYNTETSSFSVIAHN